MARKSKLSPQDIYSRWHALNSQEQQAIERKVWELLPGHRSLELKEERFRKRIDFQALQHRIQHFKYFQKTFPNLIISNSPEYVYLWYWHKWRERVLKEPVHPSVKSIFKKEDPFFVSAAVFEFTKFLIASRISTSSLPYLSLPPKEGLRSRADRIVETKGTIADLQTIVDQLTKLLWDRKFSISHQVALATIDLARTIAEEKERLRDLELKRIKLFKPRRGSKAVSLAGKAKADEAPFLYLLFNARELLHRCFELSYEETYEALILLYEMFLPPPSNKNSADASDEFTFLRRRLERLNTNDDALSEFLSTYLEVGIRIPTDAETPAFSELVATFDK
jgi:hypothetical protein